MKNLFLTSAADGNAVLYTCRRDENIAPGTWFGPIVLDLYVVECCTKGSGSFIVDGTEYRFSAGDIYILCPGQRVVYTSDPLTSREGIWCAIDGSSVARAVADLGVDGAHPFVSGCSYTDAVSLMEAMLDMNSDVDLGAPLRRTGQVYSLLGVLSRSKPVRDKNIWISKAIGYIEANYYEHISVADIAGEVGLERCYFSTLFTAKVGMSPHAYLTDIRVRKAASLLKDGDYSVTDAARAVGLDVQNFARMFKKIVGCTPIEYKKMKSKE